MDRLQLKIPLLLALAALAMWLTARCLPAFALDLPIAGTTAITPSLAGLAVTALGVIDFRRARTTVDPMHPQRSVRVVDAGVYRVSRNPIDLSFFLAPLAWADWLSHPAALPWLPGFLVIISRLQIEPEEFILCERFSMVHQDCCRRAWDSPGSA